jgi:hypothetical protein
VTSGFQTSNADFSLYVKKTNHGIIVIVIYVDDLIITGDSDADISDLNKLLKQKFEMKDLGELHYFLGIFPERDMVTTKAICLEQIVRIWDDGL